MLFLSHDCIFLGPHQHLSKFLNNNPHELTTCFCHLIFFGKTTPTTDYCTANNKFACIANMFLHHHGRAAFVETVCTVQKITSDWFLVFSETPTIGHRNDHQEFFVLSNPGVRLVSHPKGHATRENQHACRAK